VKYDPDECQRVNPSTPTVAGPERQSAWMSKITNDGVKGLTAGPLDDVCRLLRSLRAWWA